MCVCVCVQMCSECVFLAQQCQVCAYMDVYVLFLQLVEGQDAMLDMLKRSENDQQRYCTVCMYTRFLLISLQTRNAPARRM